MGISHEWNGTVLTITSDSGTSSADLRGEKGDTGVRGPQGVAGIITDTTGNIDLAGYEKKENKADTLMTDEGELEGKYAGALAAKKYTDNFASWVTNEVTNTTARLDAQMGAKADKQNVANAIKETVESVDVITAKNVSPVEHKVKVKADTDTEITVCGKNLLSVNNDTFTQYKEYQIERIPAGSYIFTGNVSTTDTTGKKFAFRFLAVDGDTEIIKKELAPINNFRLLMTFTEDVYYMSVYSASNYNASAGIEATFSNLQIEKDTRTEFEPYNKMATYTLSANTEKEIPSVYPTMSIISTSTGANLTCEYNKDISLLDNKMELIYSYDFTEGVLADSTKTDNIYATLDDNGKPFTLDEVFVQYNLGTAPSATSSTSYSIYANEYGTGQCFSFKNNISKNAKTFQFYAKRVGENRWLVMDYKGGYVSVSYNATWDCGYSPSKVDYIYGLKLAVGYANVEIDGVAYKIPPNTSVKVYGRRVY